MHPCMISLKIVYAHTLHTVYLVINVDNDMKLTNLGLN